VGGVHLQHHLELHDGARPQAELLVPGGEAIAHLVVLRVLVQRREEHLLELGREDGVGGQRHREQPTAAVGPWVLLDLLAQEVDRAGPVPLVEAVARQPLHLLGRLDRRRGHAGRGSDDEQGIGVGFRTRHEDAGRRRLVRRGERQGGRRGRRRRGTGRRRGRSRRSRRRGRRRDRRSRGRSWSHDEIGRPRTRRGGRGPRGGRGDGLVHLQQSPGEQGEHGADELRPRQGKAQQVLDPGPCSRLLQGHLLRGRSGNGRVLEGGLRGAPHRSSGIPQGGLEPRHVREDPSPLQEEAIGGEGQGEIGGDRLFHLLVADLPRRPTERGERDAAHLLRDESIEIALRERPRLHQGVAQPAAGALGSLVCGLELVPGDPPRAHEVLAELVLFDGGCREHETAPAEVDALADVPRRQGHHPRPPPPPKLPDLVDEQGLPKVRHRPES
jgi:hypothetical protein